MYMETNRKEHIKKLMLEGKDREAVRMELISQGESTANLHEEYQALREELKMPEPKPPVPPRVAFSANADAEKFVAEHKAQIEKKWLRRFLTIVLVIGVLCGVVFFGVKGLPSLLQNLPGDRVGQTEEGNTSPADVLLLSKVESTAASAKLYRGRMGFYDGVCKDITVVEPVVCKNTSEYFMIYAPLGSGGYYCTDSNNFSGEVSRPKSTRCQ